MLMTRFDEVKAFAEILVESCCFEVPVSCCPGDLKSLIEKGGAQHLDGLGFLPLESPYVLVLHPRMTVNLKSLSFNRRSGESSPQSSFASLCQDADWGGRALGLLKGDMEISDLGLVSVGKFRPRSPNQSEIGGRGPDKTTDVFLVAKNNPGCKRADEEYRQ